MADDYEEFHLVRSIEKSKRVEELLAAAGVEVRRQITEDGWHAIHVRSDQLQRAEQVFWADAGAGRGFSSG